MSTRALPAFAFALGLAACGGDDGVHHLADAPPVIGSDAPIGCMTAECTAVAGSLTGLLWELPCGADNDAKTCAATLTTRSATVAGAPGALYAITLRFRGVTELKAYDGGGGTASGYFVTGGTAQYDGYNVYSLQVSDPAQTYYLNQGPSNVQVVYALDYKETLRIATGATVTLTADPADGVEVKNVDATLQPVSVAGTSVAQPYNGQFVQMDVTAITPTTQD